MTESQESVLESEEELIEKAQTAVSQSNWVVGECAAKWTTKYARGRTDADFGLLVGLSGDQVYQRRRVWETFADVDGDYVELKWSHFYVALNWDDAPECLQWAQENEATVAEMKAWRRAMLGEDLTQPATDDWGNDLTIEIDGPTPTPVRDPDEFAPAGMGGGVPAVGSGSSSDQAVMASAAREDYSPFRKGAGSPAPKVGEEGGTATAILEKPKTVSPEQALKKHVTALERANKGLSKEILSCEGKDAEKLLKRLRTVVNDLAAKVTELP
ncbi:MAG: hypothetical protein AB8G99_16530 [Planctomycetaceae bacterium]